MVLAAYSAGAFAQGGTGSPYSQFGIGTLSGNAGAFARGTSGLGAAYRSGDNVNPSNPASLSATDSLSFIFDAGVSLHITNFKENGRSVNTANGNFDYVSAAFRLAPKLGAGFGITPVSSVGYEYSSVSYAEGGKSVASTTAHTGTGGLRQAYAAVGFEPFKGFSLGVTGAYLWGGYERSSVGGYGTGEKYANTLSKLYKAEVRSYRVVAGVQYTARLSKADQLTLGATYEPGHSIGGDPTCLVVSTNSQTGIADSVSYPSAGRLSLGMPVSVSAGLMWTHSGRLRIGTDYSLQKWGGVDFPTQTVSGGKQDYVAAKGAFKDMHKVTLGGELCPAPAARGYLSRVRYRAGLSYATPYANIGGGEGPREISATLGFGLPITNVYNNRSYLNISAQWVNRAAAGMMSENSFRINVGVTFNERWFMKWKVN